MRRCCVGGEGGADRHGTDNGKIGLAQYYSWQLPLGSLSEWPLSASEVGCVRDSERADGTTAFEGAVGRQAGTGSASWEALRLEQGLDEMGWSESIGSPPPPERGSRCGR